MGTIIIDETSVWYQRIVCSPFDQSQSIIEEYMYVCVSVNAFRPCLPLLLLLSIVSGCTVQNISSIPFMHRVERKKFHKIQSTRIETDSIPTCPSLSLSGPYFVYLRDVSFRSSLDICEIDKSYCVCVYAVHVDVDVEHSKFVEMKKRNLHSIIMHNSQAGWFCSQGNFTVVTPA